MKTKMLITAALLLFGFRPLFAQEIEKNKNPTLKKFPDLVIKGAEYDKVKPRVRVRVENRGMAASTSCTLKLSAIRVKYFVVVEKVEYTLEVPALNSGAHYAVAFTLPKPENEITTWPTKLFVDSGDVVKEFHEDNNEWSLAPQPIQRSKAVSPSTSTRAELFAHAGQTNLQCPETVVIGMIATPTGWTDYSRRVVPFENLTIVNTAQGSRLMCDYDGGRFALDRLVPGRLCTRSSTIGPHLNCRAIPTKK